MCDHTEWEVGNFVEAAAAAAEAEAGCAFGK